ncbi:RNA-directed DNA polymerase [Garciella nitratireducens]|uniref:Reverse transcriptase (RNA-dependent DNA polymerase) n=1 Tax=Garciella nitratireducens DSM 15102 TaxID=1121911 RepID=A0A1T4K5V8_9FIRM|nr:RNA-directed DNA polymerase [Garciella nitratireducens]SJZ37727.1 Reverse transcriptase (RNA-dependent DNA polymerase) [Garciella nitratireducens DSM 15102]
MILITYRHLFEELIKEEGIRQDILKASLGKRGASYVIRHTGDLSNIDTKTETTPRLEVTIRKIKDMYLSGFELKPHKEVPINDGFKLKKRKIQKPTFFPEQIMTHGVVRVMEKAMMTGMYEFSCGSIPGRGPHYGKRHIEKWINNDPENVKYIGKMDIHHFFNSIKRRNLKKWLKRNIKDKRFLKILFKFLDIFIEGLALGYYISQWLANYLLQPLDHFIKQEVLLDVKKKKEQRYIARMKRKGIKNCKIPKYHCGATHYIRYMDDMVIFGDNKKELHLIIKRIEQFLNERLGLELKGDWQVFKFDYIDKNGERKGRPLDFMGFKFYRDKTTLRKSIMIRATRKAKKISKKPRPTWHDASSMLSYMGWIKHTDTYNMYLERIKPYVNIKQLKRIVSKHSKEAMENERMDSRVLHGETSGI